MQVKNIVHYTVLLFFLGTQSLSAVPLLFKNQGLKRLPPNPTAEQLAAHSKYVLQQHYKTRSSKPTAKTTATGLRVIAAASRLGSLPPAYALTDSISLTYSGGRGNTVEDFRNDLLLFDRYLSLTQDAGSGAMVFSEQVSQAFNSSSQPLNRIFEYWKETAGIWEYEERYLYQYNASGQMLADSSQFWSGSSWEDGDVALKFYDATGNMIADTSYSWSGSSWVPYMANHYTYSASKMMTEKISYYYYTSVWEEKYAIYNTYDASDNLTEYLLKSFDAASGTWKNDMRYRYVYNAANVLVEEHIDLWNASAADWVFESKKLSKTDASENVIESISLTWDHSSAQFDTSYKETFEYNAHNLVEKEMYQSWIGPSSWGNPDVYNYYYEEYEKTGVKSPLVQTSFTIYPVPAQHTLYIEMNIPEQQNVNFSLMDMQGRIAVEQKVSASGYYKAIFPINGLCNGTYFLRAEGDKGLYAVQKISVAQ